MKEVERMAERVGEAPPEDGAGKPELRQVVEELDDLQAQIREWGELQRLLREAMNAFSVFQARLGSVEGSLGVDERQMLLQDWRMCQGKLDALTDFAAEVERIGLPLRREGRKLRGERWAVEILALQSLFEDVLKEKDPAPASLLELAGEFELTCQRCLTLADSGLRAAGDQLRRLSARLSGGVS